MVNLPIKEDTTMNYNKWVQGIAAREFSAQRVFLRDILGKSNENDQYPNNVVDSKVLPYPLNNLVPSIGNVIFNLNNSLTLLRSSEQNPICSSKENIGYINAAIADLTEAYKFVKSTIKRLDNLRITVKIER